MKPYIGKGIFRNGHTNSILASSPARKLAAHRKSKFFRKHAEEKIIPAGHGIRLSAQYNQQDQNDAPVVVLLHGWLGCSDSLYLVTLGDYLFKQGFHVVRLNLRDHGNSHHLNEKIFHSCRIQEVINACIYIHHEFNQPISLIGFSLGANFALRINAFTTHEQLALNATIAFCPVVDPNHTLQALESSLLVYRNYFMQRWKSSFYQKVNAFPHIYSKQTFDKCKNLRQATENLATQYAGFKDLDSYLNGYSIANDRLSTLQSTANIIFSKDDPIIPWQDQAKLAENKHLNILLTDHGGHCGFLEPDLSSPWIEEFSLTHLKS
ncbi:MAG: alpha/beta fold hydrolase [Gammaproteobacteria bacterium]|nr:alpha/beta fold hydrolase [Gammaproteobacteria bacterium]